MAASRVTRRQLFALATEQRGYFTAAQAVDLGYSHQAQAHHVKAGNWLRVDRGIFRLADWVPGPLDELARWSLWARGRGVVSHESAMAAYGIGEFESDRVHLTVPPGFTMSDPAVSLHIALLPRTAVTDGGGFRVTRPARTLIDIAAQAPDIDQLARAIGDAVSRGVIARRALRALPRQAEAVDPRAALYIERALTAGVLL